MHMYGQAGNPEAQSKWAIFLYAGKYGVEKDREESLSGFVLPLEQGHAPGQYVVGLHEEDKQKALSLVHIGRRAESLHGPIQIGEDAG